jgi:hypothetical protein
MGWQRAMLNTHPAQQCRSFREGLLSLNCAVNKTKAGLPLLVGELPIGQGDHHRIWHRH